MDKRCCEADDEKGPKCVCGDSATSDTIADSSFDIDELLNERNEDFRRIELLEAEVAHLSETVERLQLELLDRARRNRVLESQVAQLGRGLRISLQQADSTYY